MSDDCEFTPKFPQSVSGGDYRPLLDREELEILGRRMDVGYRTLKLAINNRSMSLKLYEKLVEIDKDRVQKSKYMSILVDNFVNRYYVVSVRIFRKTMYSERDMVAHFCEQNEWLRRLVRWLDGIGVPRASDDDYI